MSGDSDVTYFGVYDAGSHIEYLGDPLFGHFGSRGGWVRDSVQSDSDVARVVRRYPRGVPLDGVDSAGLLIRVVIDSVPKAMGDLHVGTFAARLLPPASDSAGPVLFWAGSARPAVLRPTQVPVDSILARRVREVADSVFASAQQEGDPDDSLADTHIQLRDLRVVSVPGAESLLVAHAAADVRRPGGRRADDRGQVFAVLTRQGLAVRYARFGHPEWSPRAETVLGITPLVYFTLPGDARVRVFATYTGPWESNGFAILDLSTGTALTQ